MLDRYICTYLCLERGTFTTSSSSEQFLLHAYRQSREAVSSIIPVTMCQRKSHTSHDCKEKHLPTSESESRASSNPGPRCHCQDRIFPSSTKQAAVRTASADGSTLPASPSPRLSSTYSRSRLGRYHL